VLIDWFTVAAQALNFLILVWLLRRFLYKPVLAAIDAREKKIAATIAAAAAQESTAQAASEELRKRSAAFDAERAGVMQKAVAEGAVERQHLIDSAHQDAQLLRAKLSQALAAERAELAHQLSLRTQAEVFALTRKALSELAGVALEERMIEVAVERLGALAEPQRLALAGARTVLVRSAGDPTAAARTKLEAAIHERLGAQVGVRFETAPELVCGLELSVEGVKLAWSVGDFLSTLAQDTAALAATDLAHAP
jgi:F-type H+-transporting ATPase subunit b